MSGIWHPVSAENLVRHKSGNYYLQATVGGKKIRRSLKTSDLKIAKIKRDAALAPLRAAIPGAADGIRTVGDALSLIEQREIHKPHIKPRTKEYYVELFRILRESLPLARAAVSFSGDDARQWWNGVAGKRSSSQSNNLLRFGKMAFAAVSKAGLRFDNPFDPITRMRIKRTEVEKLPSREKFEELVDSIRSQGNEWSERSALYVEFLAWTGCRKKESLAVTKKDISGNWLTIHGGEGGTKGGESRVIPINPRLRAVLERMEPLPESGPIFPIYEPVRAIRTACKRVGIERLRIHDFRHLFATMAIENGVDVLTLAEWLGHKDRGVLIMKTYAHLRKAHSLASAQKMV